MIPFFDIPRYAKTPNGIGLYAGQELIELLSNNDEIGIFFETLRLNSGVRMGFVSKHGNAQDINRAFKLKRDLWRRAGWPIENLHVITVKVSSVTDEDSG